MSKSVWRMIEAPSTRELVDGGLSAFAEDLGASLVILYKHTPLGIEGASPRSMASPMSLYAERYYQKCPLQVVKRVHNPEVAVVSDLVESAVLRRSEVVSDFYRPYRIERHLTVRLSAAGYGEAGCRGMVFCRPGRDRPWTGKEVDQLRRIRPLLASLVERSEWADVAREAARGREILAGALTLMDHSPTLLFDRDARLVWMSPSVAELVGRDAARRDLFETALGAAIRRVLAFGGALPDSVAVDLPGARAPLHASLLVTRATREPCVLVRLRAPLTDGARLRERARAFGLSRAETAVLEVLVEGKGNQEIARRLCITYGTVHSHLKSIYQKLGVHTRSEAIVKLRDA
jgi:DNA-binding CsgD family transcriptional regulator